MKRINSYTVEKCVRTYLFEYKENDFWKVLKNGSDCRLFEEGVLLNEDKCVQNMHTALNMKNRDREGLYKSFGESERWYKETNIF